MAKSSIYVPASWSTTGTLLMLWQLLTRLQMLVLYIPCAPTKNVHLSIFLRLCQKSTDLNSPWYVKSGENLT